MFDLSGKQVNEVGYHSINQQDPRFGPCWHLIWVPGPLNALNWPKTALLMPFPAFKEPDCLIWVGNELNEVG